MRTTEATPGSSSSGMSSTLRGLVPVVDAPHERRDQRHAGLRARHRLGEGEEQRHVAMNLFFLELFCCPDPFPRARELDQHALARHALLLVERDEAPRLVDRFVAVE